MYYIAHGSVRTLENISQQFDARLHQWKNIPQNALEAQQYDLKEKEIGLEWFLNNCHPEGVFFCNRCYRKHFVPDNFDLLCDGCSDILKDYHSQGFSFEFTERFNDWYANVPSNVVKARIELRERLDTLYKSDHILYQGKEVVICRVPSKNDCKVELNYAEDLTNDKKKRFIVSIEELEYD